MVHDGIEQLQLTQYIKNTYETGTENRIPYQEENYSTCQPIREKRPI